MIYYWNCACGLIRSCEQHRTRPYGCVIEWLPLAKDIGVALKCYVISIDIRGSNPTGSYCQDGILQRYSVHTKGW